MDNEDYVDRERLDALPERVLDTLEYLAMVVPPDAIVRVRVSVNGFVLWDSPGSEPPRAALVDPQGNLRDLPWALEEGLPDKAPVVFYHWQVKEYVERETAERARNN